MIRCNKENYRNWIEKGILTVTVIVLFVGTVGCGGNRLKGQESMERHEESENAVHLSREELREFNIKLKKVGPELLDVTVELPGEIALNGDRVAHVLPRVSGIVRKVVKHLGDPVQKDEVMTVIDSRELADAKSGFLAVRERLTLAESAYNREFRLHAKRITSEQEFLDARRQLAEARIAVRSAEQKLHAMGFPEKDLEQLSPEADVDYTLYEIRAPFEGTVIKKQVALGEAMSANAELYVVADLRTVWVDLTVYSKDMPIIRPGLEVTIRDGHGIPPVDGVISYVGPLVGESTRTAMARVVLDNPDGILRPGMFISATIKVHQRRVEVAVPLSAIQNIDGKKCVFVAQGDELVARPVTLGLRSGDMVEVISGVSAGTRCAVTGTFTLKAELAKGSFGEGHAH